MRPMICAVLMWPLLSFAQVYPWNGSADGSSPSASPTDGNPSGTVDPSVPPPAGWNSQAGSADLGGTGNSPAGSAGLDAPSAPPPAPELNPTPPPPPEPYAQEAGSDALLDGKVRQGAFLSGPGSLAFVLHHTLLGAAAGMVTQGYANEWSFGPNGREGMLVGALLGAGLGFGASAWWQFNHWMDHPAAAAALANSVAGGLLMLGLVNLLSHDSLVLSWSAVLGMELGAWLTTMVGGGQLPANHALLMGSGAAFGAGYAALLIGIVGNAGTHITSQAAFDTIAISTGVGAAAMALATLKFNPTPSQILRADLFGAGAGAAVLLLSGALLGFNQATPYVLSLLGTTGAITAVSLLWDERAERGHHALAPGKGDRYRAVWW